jgi:hypothetical protein
MTADEEFDLLAARRERPRPWVSTDLRGYPALPAEEETEATLGAAPGEKADKRPKPQVDAQAN